MRLIHAGDLRPNAGKGSTIEARAEAVSNVLSEQSYHPRAAKKIINQHGVPTQAVGQTFAVERAKGDASLAETRC